MSTATETFGETHESKLHFQNAMEMVARNNVQVALGHLEEALRIAPNNPTYLSRFGLCMAIAHADFDAAIKLCERAIKIDPSDPVSHVNLGKVHKMQGDNSAAYSEFIRAWKSDNSHPSPAAELQRMGIRRRPVVPFLPRGHWINVKLGQLRAKLERVG